jgi:hypothetical protein
MRPRELFFFAPGLANEIGAVARPAIAVGRIDKAGYLCYEYGVFARWGLESTTDLEANTQWDSNPIAGSARWLSNTT